jgi:prephenate dehydratase
MIQILIQGFEGSNHDLAAREYFGTDEIHVLPCMTFRELFDKLVDSPSLFGMVAMENTLAGSLLPNYNLMRKSGLRILGEHKMRISHQLLALPGQDIDDFTEVHSHPMALAQCEDFLLKHPHLKLIETEDTALSAKLIRQNNRKGIAAIASKLAGQLFDLEIMAENIESNPHNFTRFLLVGHTDQIRAESLPLIENINKSSLVFSLPHESGSLSRVLSVLAFYGVSLTKIQSLPVIGKEWEYLFYIDLGYTDYHRYRQSLDAIRPLSIGLEVLGEYETHESRTMNNLPSKIAI